MKRNKRTSAKNKKASNQEKKWELLDKINNLLLEATKIGQTMGA